MAHTDSTPRHADMMIKVCGMRDPRNIADVASLAPMLMGFIFHEGSPRNAKGLSPECVKSLPGFIHTVAVTVNKADSEIMDLCDTYGFKIVQLHGNESPEQCRRLKESGHTVFKAIGLNDECVDWERVSAYENAVDMFVFDYKCESHGGSGKKFSWDILVDYPLKIPYLLSGGIGPDDVDAIVAAMRPGMAGIDINSKFETAPGIKNLSKLINFIVSLRKFNEYEPNSIPFWEKAK